MKNSNFFFFLRKKVKKLSCVANSTLNASVISNSSTSSASNNSFCTKQAVDKATARAVRALPKSPKRKTRY